MTNLLGTTFTILLIVVLSYIILRMGEEDNNDNL
jgi:hypothetical protein